MVNLKIYLFRSLALTSFLAKIENSPLSFLCLIQIIESLLNHDKKQLYLLESLLSQALWVAGK